MFGKSMISSGMDHGPVGEVEIHRAPAVQAAARTDSTQAPTHSQPTPVRSETRCTERIRPPAGSSRLDRPCCRPALAGSATLMSFTLAASRLGPPAGSSRLTIGSRSAIPPAAGLGLRGTDHQGAMILRVQTLCDDSGRGQRYACCQRPPRDTLGSTCHVPA
jgi:hypothetical protein